MGNSKLFYAAAKVIIKNSSNEILLLQAKAKDVAVSTSPYWDLPGGRLEEGQDFEATLKRELYEETGMDLKQLDDLSLLTVAISNRNARWHRQSIGLLLVVYRSTIVKTDIKLSEEHLAFAWVNKTEAKKRLAFKYSADFIQLL